MVGGSRFAGPVRLSREPGEARHETFNHVLHGRIGTVQGRCPGWFDEQQVAILPVAVKRGTVYRARFYGLTEARAAKACKRLRKKRQRCITVSPAGFNLALAN